MKPEIREATLEDALSIGARARAADIAECWAASHHTPTESMIEGVNISTKAWTATFDGVPLVMFGVAPASAINGIGVPWLLAADGLERHQLGFLTHCRPCLDEIRAIYPRLYNFVDARNQIAIRWLRWLGFTFGEPIPYGKEQLLFLPFKMEPSNV